MVFTRSHRRLVVAVLAVATAAVLISTGSVLYLRWRRENTVQTSLQLSASNDFRSLAALMKTPLVLKAALQRPGIQDLMIVKKQRDPVEWLIQTVVVSAEPESAQIHLSLQPGIGADVKEARLLLDAIVDTYREQLPRVSLERVEVRLID